MKYKLVIFDLDGTTLSSLQDLANSLNFVLAQNGFPQRSMEEVRRFVGNGIRKLVERGVPDGTPKEKTQSVLEEFVQHYKAHCSDNTKPYDGIIELLTSLRQRGYLTAVVSNKADEAVQILCEKYFHGLFDVVVGERRGVKKKPAPDTVNSVLEKLNVNRQDAVYVGDSEVDVQTAKNADMDCLSVDWGFRSREELISAGAVKILSRPQDLLQEV